MSNIVQNHCTQFCNLQSVILFPYISIHYLMAYTHYLILNNINNEIFGNMFAKPFNFKFSILFTDNVKYL